MIRKLELKDKENWTKLYNGYADFYKVPINAKILDTVWEWINDKNHVVNGICFDLDSKIVGIAHYRTMPRPLKGQYIGFLDDLFVSPEFRGLKIGEKIILKLNEISREKGWGLVRWITRSDNLRAKSLYDRVSNKTNWEVYEL